MNDHIREEDLAAYIEGTIAPKMRPAIERHLTGCDRCLDDLADLAQILKASVPVPGDLLKTALSRYPAAEEAAKRRHFRLPNRWALQVAALFGVALLLGYLLIVHHPPVGSSRKVPEVSDRETGPADKPLTMPADQKEISPSIPAPAKIEKKSALRRINPPAEQAKANATVREKDELRFSREEEDGKLKEALDVSQQVRLETQKGQLSKGPAPQSRFRARQDQAVGAPVQAREAAPPPVAIVGDVTMGDLQNREILADFLHFPEPLTARIAVDPQGKVIEVTIETPIAPEQKIPLQALIGKLLFSPSDKKIRLARLTSGLAPLPK